MDGSEGTNSNLIAKESRLSLDIRGPWQDKELQMYFEGDFYGTSSAFRLRMAYGRWGGLMAGQNWSTFVDEDNLPRTIDFEAPTAFAQIRQAQYGGLKVRKGRGTPRSKTTSRQSRSRPTFRARRNIRCPTS